MATKLLKKPINLGFFSIQWGFLTQSFVASSGIVINANFPLRFTSHLAGVVALNGDTCYRNGTLVGMLFHYTAWNTEKFSGSYNVRPNNTSDNNATYIAIGI